eukprot:6600204-Prymnesium_polylepis.2
MSRTAPCPTAPRRARGWSGSAGSSRSAGTTSSPRTRRRMACRRRASSFVGRRAACCRSPRAASTTPAAGGTAGARAGLRCFVGLPGAGEDWHPAAQDLSLIHISEPTRRS